jgi:hypothetical protein
LSVLNHYPAYRAFRARSAINGDEDGGAVDAPSADTPQEALDKAYLTARVETEAELLRRVVERPPAFVEVEDGGLAFWLRNSSAGARDYTPVPCCFPQPQPWGLPPQHRVGA